MQPQIEAMLKQDGVYICKDTGAPGTVVVLVVSGHKVYQMKLDDALDPERFYDTCVITGPVDKFPDAN